MKFLGLIILLFAVSSNNIFSIKINEEQIIGKWQLKYDPDSFEIDKMPEIGFFEKQMFNLFAKKKMKDSFDSNKVIMSFFENGDFKMASNKSKEPASGTWKIEKDKLVIESQKKENQNSKKEGKRKFSMNLDEGEWNFVKEKLFFFFKKNNSFINSGMYLMKVSSVPV